MAMSSGGGISVRSEINITPLVDVVLVLLIIFMVATPILQMGIDVEVPPKVEVTAPQPQNADQLVVSIKPDGIYLNSALMQSPQALRDRLAPILKGKALKERVVFVTGDDRVPFDRVVTAMDAAREAGAYKVGFLTDPVK